MFRRSKQLNRVGKKFVSQRKLFVEPLDSRMMMAGLEQPQPIEISAQFANTPLAKTYYEYVAFQQASETVSAPGNAAPSTFEPSDPSIHLRNGLLPVELIGNPGNSTSLRDALFALGALSPTANENLGSSSASGMISLDKIPQMYATPGLVAVNGPSVAITHVGSIDTQGDKAQRSDELRNFLGLTGVDGTGHGLKIGVISDSFNSKTAGTDHANTNVASYDLPGSASHPYGNNTAVTVIGSDADPNSTPPPTDEGRAMLQLIHDVAPMAKLYFSIPGDTHDSYKAAIIALKDAGCDVIVDDIMFTNEPMFLDGPVAQGVDIAVGAGRTYVSAAGNQAENSYESTAYVSSGVTRTVNGRTLTLHDFNTTAIVDPYQLITIPEGTSVDFAFQWQEPFKTVATGSTGALTDFDIVLYDSAGNNLAAADSYSTRMNKQTSGGTGDPSEWFSFTNPVGSGVTSFNLAIGRYDGSGGGMLKYVIFNNNAVINEYQTNSPTLYGHTNAAGAISVAAAPFHVTPEYGQSPAFRSSSTSEGGVPILFDSAGQSISAIDRQNPDLTGPTGGNTTFFGTDIPEDADSYPNFFGTSAAAPHIAALAALLKNAQSSLTPAQITTALTSTAQDMPYGTGRDYFTGYGFVDGKAALLSVDGSAPRLVTFPGTTNSDTLEIDTASGQVRFTYAPASQPEFTFPKSKISQIIVLGDSGNDTIFVEPSETLSFSVVVAGNLGDDSLTLQNVQYMNSVHFNGHAGTNNVQSFEPIGDDYYKLNYETVGSYLRLRRAGTLTDFQSNTFSRDYTFTSASLDLYSGGGDLGFDRLDMYGTTGVAEIFGLGISGPGSGSVVVNGAVVWALGMNDIRAISNISVGGNDSLNIYGTPSAETLHAYYDHGEMTAGGVYYYYGGIESVTAYANGGADTMNFYPKASSNNKLKGNYDGLANPNSATEAVAFHFGNTDTSQYYVDSSFQSYAVARGFTSVYTNASGGSVAPNPWNRAYIHGTTGNDYFDTQSDGTNNRRSYLTDGSGNLIHVRNFGFVDAYAYTGNDTAVMDDTNNDYDKIEVMADTTKIFLNSQASLYYNYLTGFDTVNVYAVSGTTDSGKNTRKNLANYTYTVNYDSGDWVAI